MKKERKIILIILIFIILSAIGGGILLLRISKPGSDDMLSYMEKVYGKDFEILEEFTYISYTDGEPEVRRELKCPAVELQDKENSEIRCIVYAYPQADGAWTYRNNYSKKVLLYCMRQENLMIKNEDECSQITSFAYPCLILENTDETAQKLQNMVIRFNESYQYDDNYHNISGQESFAVEGSIYIESVLAGDVSDRWTEETGRFCYDTSVEKYKAFLEELEQAVNREESIYAFHVPENISREIVLSDYSETFPVNLQEALVYANDDIPEENHDNAWMEYRAECEYEKITIEIDGYASPFENVNALEADIDSDGEKEYIFSVSEGGTAHDVRTIVAKSVNGEWLQIGGLTSKNSAVRALLEWEDQYYLLMGNHLTYWNGEADEPNWKEHPVPGQAECWNTLSIEKKVTGYTPLEVYSFEEDLLAYWRVLNNEQPFVSTNEDYQEFYWNEYNWWLGRQVEYHHADSFMLVDMDGDGGNEVVLYCSPESTQVLHYEDGVVYGYQFGFRGMKRIHQNGVYEGSDGAASTSYHRLTELNKEGCTEETIAVFDHYYDYYEVEGVEVTYEKLADYVQSIEDVALAETVEFTEDMLACRLLGKSAEGTYER